MDTLYYFVQEINTIIYSFIGSFLAVSVFYFLILYSEKGISPLSAFRGQQYMFLKIVHAKIQDLLMEGKTTEETKSVVRNLQFPFFVLNPPCTNDKVDFVRSVLANDELLEQYLFQFRFSYADYRRLLVNFNEDNNKLKADRAVRMILNDESNQNVEVILPLLVEIHTKPFVVNRQLGISAPVGRNEMAAFQALSDMKILKKTCTPQLFGSTMSILKEKYPSMDVLRGRSTIYYHADKITHTDKEFWEIVAITRQYIEEKLG